MNTQNKAAGETATQYKLDTILEVVTGNKDPHEALEEMGYEATEDNAIVLQRACREWDNAPCDPEGTTKEQDEHMDLILKDALNDLK